MEITILSSSIRVQWADYSGVWRPVTARDRNEEETKKKQ